LPADGLNRFLSGTPPILSMAAAEPGIDLVLRAGTESIREKSVLQTEFLMRLYDLHLAPLGFALNSPRDSAARGSHVSLSHPLAFAIDLALIHEMKVIPDFRSPDNLRLGVAPLYTRFVDLYEGVMRIKRVVEGRLYERYTDTSSTVT
jgi:kynureninase